MIAQTPAAVWETGSRGDLEAERHPVVAERKRILIVEHDPDLAEMMRLCLLTEGYDAEALLRTPASSAEVQPYHPDLLLLDLRPAALAPQDDRFLDTLRTSDATRPVPVMAITTSEAQADAA